MRRLKVFLSYSSEDDHLAGQYKEYLETHCGFLVYVAHVDNIPGVDWAPQIKENIASTDVLVVLVSKDSKKSNYVNQEIGIAIGLNLKIFPFMIDGTPPFGFIDKIHGFPFVADESLRLVKHCSTFFSLLTTHTPVSKDFGDLAIDSAIHALSKSPNWIDTNVIVRLLTETENLRKFNNDQLEAIKSACCSNYEVYGGANSYPAFKKLLETKYGIKGLV